MADDTPTPLDAPSDNSASASGSACSDTPAKSDTLIRQFVVPGSAQHFRGTMERLCYRDWQSSKGVQLAFGEERQTKRELVAVVPPGSPAGPHSFYLTSQTHYRDVDITPPTRTTWHVMTKGEDQRHSASIEVFEQPDGKTTLVEFVDGALLPYWRDAKKAIGGAFQEFAQYVIAAHKGASLNAATAPPRGEPGIETTGENQTGAQATSLLHLRTESVHFRTLYLRCDADKIQAALSTLSYEWEGWEAALDMRVAWHQQSNPRCPKAHFEVLDDPAYPHQYTLGTIETVDLPGEIWAVTFTEYKLSPAPSDESQAELDRHKARIELFWKQAQMVESCLAEGQSLDRIWHGMTLLRGVPPVLVVDCTSRADNLPNFKIECQGTAEQVHAAIANIAAQWRDGNRIYRLTPQADGSYSIWSKPHGYQHYKPNEINGFDYSHRECGEMRLLSLPDGAVRLIFRAIQKADSVNSLKRWQAALPFVCHVIRELHALKFLGDCKEYSLPSAYSTSSLEDNPEVLPPVTISEAEPALFRYFHQDERGSLPGQVWGTTLLFPVDAPTFFQHAGQFLKSQKNTAYVQPMNDGISWHIQYHTLDVSEPQKGQEFLATLRAFIVRLEDGKEKPTTWRYDPSERLFFNMAEVHVAVKRVHENSCMVSTHGWTQAGRRVLEKLGRYIEKLYPPEKYGFPPNATVATSVVNTTSLIGQPNAIVQRRRSAIRELLSKSNYPDYQLVQLLKEQYSIAVSESTVKRDRAEMGIKKRGK